MNLPELLRYFSENLQDIFDKTLEHLWLTGISIFLAISIGVLTGIMLTRKPKWSTPVLGFANVIQTVPSIALLGFMIPLVGIGPTPAIIALFLYSLLPIIRNTYTGILEVNPATKEAGIGLGLTNRQLLMKVELPLALPTIFAGIRTATVINVGVATLCALIAAGGLGEFIFTGIALNNVNMIMAGAIPAALLAITLDVVLGIVEKKAAQWRKALMLLFVLSAVSLLTVALLKTFSKKVMTAGLTSEFMERKDGWKGLKKKYNLAIKSVQMDAGLMYMALKNQKVDVIGGYSTDGRIQAYHLSVLNDDLHFFPPYYVAPLVSTQTLESHPEVQTILNQLHGKINNQTMRLLNYKVDHLKQSPHEVAKVFLDSLGMKTDLVRNGEPDIIIGAKNFTEQYILVEMMAMMIENQSTLDVELKTGLGGTKICFDALKAGEIDLYPEYTGTGFLVLLKPSERKINEIIRDKDAVYHYVKDELYRKYNLTLLEPFGFNNTYALMVRKDFAKKEGLTSISDLAEFLRR